MPNRGRPIALESDWYAYHFLYPLILTSLRLEDWVRLTGNTDLPPDEMRMLLDATLGWESYRTFKYLRLDGKYLNLQKARTVKWKAINIWPPNDRYRIKRLFERWSKRCPVDVATKFTSDHEQFLKLKWGD